MPASPPDRTTLPPPAIREARAEDAESIARILNRIIEARTYTALDTPFTVEDERRFIESFPERGIFLVAVSSDEGRVLGFQNLQPFATYTRAFDHVGVLGTFVDLDYRRRGIARRLFGATFEAALQKGYEKIFTYIRADNPAALSAYAAHGFRIIGTARRHAKIDGQYVDEIIIEKILDSG